MANAISNVKVGNTVYGVAPEFIYGTQTASTGAWTGVTKDSELFDGKIIEYFLPFAGSGNATLNLTLADGTTTGAKNCYYNSTSRLTTHYGQYSQFTLIYHKALNIGGTNYEGWWVADKGYYSQNIYDQYTVYSPISTKANLYRYKLCVTVDESQILPLNSVNATSSSWAAKTMTTDSFDPFGAIYYYGTTSTVSAGGKVGNYSLYIMHNLIDVTYSLSSNPSLVANKALYLVCVPQGNGLVKLDSSIVTQTLPTSEDGKVYIYLGQMYDTYRLSFMPNHPVYEYKDGSIRLYSGADLVTQSELTNAINALPEPMLFKGTVGSGGTITSLPAAAAANEGWTYKVITAMSSPVSAKVGDTVISNGSAWVVIPSGDEPSGTVTNVAAVGVGPITVTGGPITTTGTFTISHQNSGVTAASYGPSEGGTLAHSGSFTVPQFTVNATGHITSAGSKVYTLPASGNTNFTTHLYTNADTAKGVLRVLDNSTTRSTVNFVGAGGIVVSSTASASEVGTVTITHSTSGATAGSYGSSAGGSLGYGGTFTVPYVTVDAQGHVTAISSKGFTLPASDNTDAKVEQKAAMTTAGAFPIILAAATATTATTTYVNKSANLTYNPSTKALNTGGTVNGYTLAAASAKGVDTSIAEGSTSTNLPTSAAVAALVSSMVGDYMPISGGTFTGSVVAPDLEVGDLVVNGGANFNNGLKSNGKDVLVGGSNSSSAVTISCTSTTITPTNGTTAVYVTLTSTSYTPRTNKTVVTGGTSVSFTPVGGTESVVKTMATTTLRGVAGTVDAYTALTTTNTLKPITNKTVVVSGTSTSITPVDGTETVLKTLATTSLKGVSGTTNAYTSLTSTTFKPVTKKTVVVSATVDGSVLTISTGDSVTEGSTTTIVTGGTTSAVATANANATTVATGSAATTATVAKAGEALNVYTGLTTGDSVTEGTALAVVIGGTKSTVATANASSTTVATGSAASSATVATKGTATNVYVALTTGDSTGAGDAINVVTGGTTAAVAKAASSTTKVITGITSATAAAQTFTGVTE